MRANFIESSGEIALNMATRKTCVTILDTFCTPACPKCACHHASKAKQSKALCLCACARVACSCRARTMPVVLGAAIFGALKRVGLSRTRSVRRTIGERDELEVLLLLRGLPRPTKRVRKPFVIDTSVALFQCERAASRQSSDERLLRESHRVTSDNAGIAIARVAMAALSGWSSSGNWLSVRS